MSDYQFIDGWIIRETEYKPNEEMSKATVFALANGYMGCRGAGEEIPPRIAGAKGTYINGIYDTPNGKLTEREFPNIQDWTVVKCKVDGEMFDLSRGTIHEYERELDMRSAVMRRKIHWANSGGKEVLIESERLVSMAQLHLGAIRWRLTAKHDIQLWVRGGTCANVNNRWAKHFKAVHARQIGNRGYVETATFNPGYVIGALTECVIKGSVPKLEPTDHSIHCDFELTLKAGETIEMVKWAALHDSRFTEGDILSACAKELDSATALGYDNVKQEHVKRWAKLWEQSSVDIEGDDEAQMGIRFSIFHLLAAAPHHNDKISVPARGLQGQDYYGSVFWDCEIFVLPFYIYTQPSAARNCLGYRYHTLPGAKRKAENLGFKGAYYAWQSQETGDDQCDLYVFDDPRTGEKIRSYFADEQIHISGDIAYALIQYYNATKDSSFMTNEGVEILVEVARFFASRSVWDMVNKRWVINSVLGPDEYHERVNNNAYTNHLARFVLQKAVAWMAMLEATEPQLYQLIMQKTGLTSAEIEQWKEMANDALFVPQPNPNTHLIEQFDGYFQLKDEPVDETRKRLAHPDLHPGGPLGPFQETQNIKQADVIMLLYLFRDCFDLTTKLANWNYYEPRTAHDSSLSPMAYSLVAADAGMTDWAYEYFMRTAHIDLASYGPHWNLGIHSASLGGAWLALVHGFCKLNLSLNAIHITSRPQLPKHWTKATINFDWQGAKMRLTVQQDRASLEMLSGTKAHICWWDKKMTVLKPGGIDEHMFGQAGE